MFKKYKLIVGILTVGLVTSSFGQTVGASANEEDVDTQKENNRYVNQGEVDKDQYAELEQFLSNCLAKWNVKWNDSSWKQKENGWKNNSKPKKDQVVEEPVDKAPEQEVEQPQPQEPEQPEQNEQVEQGNNEQAEQNNNQNQNEEKGQLNQFEQQVFDLTNKERTKNGLPALKVDYELSKVAREKSRDMAANNYFDHNSPTYGSPFDMMKTYGINYRSAGENIAKGQRTPEEVVNAWMNSEGHRANILNGSFTHIGVGYVEQGNHWTQQFIGK